MPEKFPEVLPPKGEGRVDSKHRVALLTEPEIGALNFLKNMDRSMGFKSGFSPMMQNLAAQNTQPLEYVEYRGEKIPSLNDYGSYGSGDSGSGSTGGNTSDTYSGGDDGDDWYSKYYAEVMKQEQERQKQIQADIEYADAMSVQTKQSTYTGQDSETLADEEEDQFSELTHDGRPEREPGSYGGGQDQGGRGEGTQNYGDGTTTVTNSNGETITVDGGGSVVPNPIYKDWEGEGNYTSQALADARNKELMDAARDSAYNTSQTYLDTEYGSEYGDEVSADVDAYVNSFGDELNLAYEQAQDGLYDAQAQSGVWNQEGYNESLAALNTALGSERDALGDYGDQFKADYTNTKNTWKTEQDAAADALYNMNNQEGYNLLKQHGLGYYNEDGTQKHGLDLSSFKDNQDFGGDFAGDDYDFLGEFSKITPDGEKIKATSLPSTETTDTGTTEEGSDGSTSKTKKKKKYRTTANTSLTGSGSSTNVN